MSEELKFFFVEIKLLLNKIVGYNFAGYIMINLDLDLFVVLRRVQQPGSYCDR